MSFNIVTIFLFLQWVYFFFFFRITAIFPSLLCKQHHEPLHFPIQRRIINISRKLILFHQYAV